MIGGIIAFVFVVFLCFIVGIIALSKNKRDSVEKKGEIGELEVAKVLGDTIVGEQYVINDLLFVDSSGHSCQIDHVYINKYGIYVIETKNYSGFIYGKENEREWTQVLARGNVKNKFNNPIKQNKTHIYRLSEYLQFKNKNFFHNIVVFLPHADISNVIANNVYTTYSLHRIKQLSTEDSLTVDEMENYYNKLLELKNQNAITKDEHKQYINKMQLGIQEGICPRCGGKLVLRDGKNGQFYGCSNYPGCKFTKNIN